MLRLLFLYFEKLRDNFTPFGNCVLIFLILVMIQLRVLPTSSVAFGKPIAKVNGTILKEADVQEALNEILPAGVFHGGFSSEKRAKYRPKALEKMIENELFYQEALRMGLDVEEEVKKSRDETIKRLGGEKKFNAALKNAGITNKQYKLRLSKKFLITELITMEIMDQAHPSDEEVEVHYDKNKEKFKRPEARNIKHILIKVEPNANAEERQIKKVKAQEVIDKIKAGVEISVLARVYSDGPYRVKGGDFGLVHKGQLLADFEKEVFKLATGQLSGIIETI